MAGDQEWINDRLIRMATENGYGEAKSFIPIPQALRKCIKLSSTEKDVLYHLLYSMNDKGYCFPTHGTIANGLFLSGSTVIRAIKKLERMSNAAVCRWREAGTIFMVQYEQRKDV